MLKILQTISLAIAVLLTTSAPSRASDQTVEEYLRSQPAGTKAPMIVYLKEKVSYSQVRRVLRLQARNPAEARDLVFGEMRSRVENIQIEVRRILSGLEGSGNVENVQPFWLSNAIAIDGDSRALQQLEAAGAVERVLLDLPEQRLAVQPGTMRKMGPGAAQETPWGIEMVKAREANQDGATGKGIRIAIIDTGIDPDNADFAEGQIDMANAASFAPGEEGDVNDGHGHGTHCAGSAASPPFGVATEATIVPVKIFTGGGWTSMRAILAGLEHGTLHADVLSNSWGGGPSTQPGPEEDAIHNAVEAGKVVIIAAGNSGPREGSVGTPAIMVSPGVLAVAAIDSSNEAADFSSRGPSVRGDAKPEVAAPGVDVLSTLPDGEHAKWSGTSMATPHVAGLAALLMARFPELTNVQIVEVIKLGTYDNAIENVTGAGTIHCQKALEAGGEELERILGGAA